MSSLVRDETARFQQITEQLRTAVIGDVLDVMDRPHQFLPPTIHVVTRATFVVGRADPVLIGDVFGAQAHPFGKLTEALDDLRPGDVYLARAARTPCAAWGELLTTAARSRGARGAVIDGYHRDTRQIAPGDWPVLSRGAFGQDSAIRAAVLAYRTPVFFGAVHVFPGDLVIGDEDGVLVVPRDIEDEVLERALEKSELESAVRAALSDGVSATAAFARYQVL